MIRPLPKAEDKALHRDSPRRNLRSGSAPAGALLGMKLEARGALLLTRGQQGLVSESV